MEDYKPSLTPMNAGVKLSTFSDEDPVDPTLYMQLNGSLIYLTTIRPDISFVVGLCFRFMSDAQQSH